MIRKQLLSLAAFATLAAAGTAARADDITMAAEIQHFMSTKTRAEVRAELLKARAEGTAAVSEIDLTPTMATKPGSVVSRDEVRAQAASPAARSVLRMWYPA